MQLRLVERAATTLLRGLLACAENRELRKKVEDMKVALTEASAKEKHLRAVHEAAVGPQHTHHARTPHHRLSKPSPPPRLLVPMARFAVRVRSSRARLRETFVRCGR
jgi:hypothetical protein